jgi:hypothetical protein
MTQAEMSAINRAAWNADTYQGWPEESGTPTELAARLEPRQKLRRVLRQLGEVSGKRVANPFWNSRRRRAGIGKRTCQGCSR